MFLFFLQAEDGIRDLVRSRGLGDVYKRQTLGPQVDCIIVLAAESEFLRSYLTAALMGAAGFGLSLIHI